LDASTTGSPRCGPNWAISPGGIKLAGGFALRWWRRNDGFEWKEYVRTTVLVRRQHRRDKIEAAKLAAVEGVKEAGRKGLAAGAAGAEAAGQMAAKIAKSAADGAVEHAERGSALFVRSLAAARSRVASVSEPMNARLSVPRVSLTLGAVAGLACAGFVIRTWKFGADGDALVLGAVAAVAAVLWLWPRLFSNSQDAVDGWDSRTERVVAAVDRAGSWLPMGVAVTATALFLWLAAPVSIRWFETARPSPSRHEAAEAAAAADVVLEGTARVAGPGVVRVAGRSVQLDGVTMLDFAQDCRRADGSNWACGAAAKQTFEKLVRSRKSFRCEITGDADGIAIGKCSADGKVLASELVRQGYAFADGTLWSAYSTEESEAKAAKAGLWAGEPERPEDWRERLYADAAASAPGGCPIKGRIQSGRKTYVLPYSTDYARLTLREDRGERWFCSTEDAELAGFQARDSRR
jgi:endonuclease YncB( thermonuclease family)